jgi:nitrate reductase molybdenum cofactor assembly chaperone NarJ/NarW
MEKPMITYRTLSNAFRYPAPGRLQELQAGLEGMPEGGSRKAFGEFLARIRRLSLGEWEELHTRTLDLNPPAAPYVGFQTWGDSYPRGEFMACLSHAYAEAGLSTGGELPDHLSPVLDYLAAEPRPLPELTEALPGALERMSKVLQKAEAGNPYVLLFESARRAIGKQ